MRGGVAWTPQRLTWTALLISWDEGQTMTSRFEHACRTGRELHAHWRLGTAYSGFTAALAEGSAKIVEGLRRRFQEQMRQLAGPSWRCRGWCAFAADGTRIEAPHTAANEATLGCAGKEKSAPQVFLTSLWHLGLGLPWDFRVGPGTDSERRHVEAMLDGLPSRSLLVADAGFCGYELCRNLIDRDQAFLLRVGSNVTLLTELGYHVEERAGTVYLWPEKFRDQSPLVLRLIVLRRGTQTLHLLTSVLDPQELSDEDAAVLYEMRWGIEVGYRSYKQTLDRRQLLSRKPENCLWESQWTMLGLWLLGLLCVSRQRSDPRRWSTAAARDVVRRATRRSWQRLRRGQLNQELRRARCDTYARPSRKEARNYPRKKRRKPPGPPQIKPASPHQVRLAAKLLKKLHPAA